MLCALGGFSLLLGLASREQRLQRWTRPLSGLVWVALLALGHGFLFTGGVVSAWDQVRGAAGAAGQGGGGAEREGLPGLELAVRTPAASGTTVSTCSFPHSPRPPPPPPQVSFFIFVIFTTYAMLPLGMRDAAAAGLTSSLSHLLVLGLYLGPQPDSRPALLPQVSTHMAQALPGTGSPGRCLVVWAFTNWLLNCDPMAGRHSWAQGANTGRSPLCPPGVSTPVQHHACRHHERGLDLQGRKFDGGPGCWGQIWTMEPSQKKKMQNLELG